MPLPVRLPDLEHWKAQVKCQAGCPVSTDAGRYVQLIAAGRHEEAYLATLGTASPALWLTLPFWIASRRLDRADI